MGPEFELISFDHAHHFLGFIIRSMHALYPVALLLQVKFVLTIATKELHCHIPLSSDLDGSRAHRCIFWTSLLSEKVVDSICHDFIIAWLHLPGSNADMGLSIGSGVATYRNPGFIPCKFFSDLFAGDIELVGIPGYGQYRGFIIETFWFVDGCFDSCDFGYLSRDCIEIGQPGLPFRSMISGSPGLDRSQHTQHFFFSHLVIPAGTMMGCTSLPGRH